MSSMGCSCFEFRQIKFAAHTLTVGTGFRTLQWRGKYVLEGTGLEEKGFRPPDDLFVIAQKL